MLPEHPIGYARPPLGKKWRVLCNSRPCYQLCGLGIGLGALWKPEKDKETNKQRVIGRQTDTKTDRQTESSVYLCTVFGFLPASVRSELILRQPGTRHILVHEHHVIEELNTSRHHSK